jgi:hypothetical protein
MHQGLRRFPAALLTAFGLGLLTCPLSFIVMGALHQFSPMFSVVMLPLFIAAAAFLLGRYLTTVATPARHPELLLLLETVSWLVVAAFNFFISGISLLTPFGRVGALCLSLLITSALFLPFVLLRPTRLEQRLARLPAAGTAAVALLVLVGVVSVAIVHLRMAAPFIGSPQGEPPPVGSKETPPSSSPGSVGRHLRRA